MNDKLNRRKLRAGVGRYSWALLVYYALLNHSVSSVTQIQLIYEGFQAVIAADSWSAFPEGITKAIFLVSENAWGYLIACAAAVWVIWFWKGKDFFRGMFETKQIMTGKSFASLLCIFISGQLGFQILAVLEEMLLNLFGLSVLESMQMASAGADSMSMFLYMGLAAPIVEEIVFRGVLLRGLEPYGKRFAILASSVLFGLFHGNLVQSPYAFAVGLVLGYTAMEYSIGWAMVLHMFNNLILGDSLMRLSSLFGTGVGDVVFWMICLISGAAAAAIVLRSRKQIRVWLKENPPSKGMMGIFFSAPANILLILLMGANAILLLWI